MRAAEWEYASPESIVKLLIDNGADVNAKDSKGQTALEFAVEYGYLGIIELLRDAGVYVGEKDWKIAQQRATGV